jgi:branched-chain amino acid transport system permease protein
MEFDILLSVVITGLMLGAIYASASIGLSMIFGVIRVINFAHGGCLMAALYATYLLWFYFGMNPYISVFIVMPLFFLFGYAIQGILIKPMFTREKALVVEPLGVLLLTAGLDLVLMNLALLLFKSDPRTVDLPIATESLSLFGSEINITRLIMVAVAIIITVVLYWILNRTSLGANIRAVGQNREAAALCGINVYKIYNITFGLGIASLALTGAMMTPFYYVSPTAGLVLGIKSYVVVVLGGLGSIPGALLAGFLLGLVEAISSQYVTATSAIMFSFLIFIIVLFIRPRGFMGKL